MTTFNLIFAATRDGLIALDGKLPWHCPEDMKFFKATTTGHPVIMGRKTWESMGKRLLPGRVNIILTRDTETDWARVEPGAIVVHTVGSAMHHARLCAMHAAVEDVYVIGGAEIYEAFMPHAAHVYSTWILSEVERRGQPTMLPPFLMELAGGNPVSWQFEGRRNLSEQAVVERWVRVLDLTVDCPPSEPFTFPQLG